MRILSKPTATAGGTLTELMVAVAILSVGVLGLFGAFRYITRSIFVSRAQSLATNLAQERIESLKNLSYYALQLTTASATDSTVSPAVLYDTGNYPPETIAIGGITYTRYTYVTMAQMTNGDIADVAFTYPDTGLKQISVNVLWSEMGVKKKWSLRNLLENPNVNPLDATIAGTISKATGGGLASALVVVEQNEDWGATTNASGGYSFQVYHGSYTVRASSTGFIDAVSGSVSVGRGGTATVNLSLTAIATGTISGIAWTNPNLVISQVVAATNTWAAEGAVREVEYVELFNPTTAAIDIGVTGDPKIRIDYDCEGGLGQDRSHADFNFVFLTTYVPAGRYYLLASATSFMINGAIINADACFGLSPNCDTSPTVTTYLDNERAAALNLKRYADNAYYDTVCWDDDSNFASTDSNIGPCEGTSIPNYVTTPARDGLQAGNQLVRVSSPGISPATLPNYGRAYDSDNNNLDFLYPSASFDGLVYPPKNTASGAFTTITGKVALGAYVSASDPNSGSTQTYTAYISSGALSLPYSRFALTGVSTGTWSVAAASGAYAANYENVIVNQNSITAIPNAVTSPAWLGSGLYHAHLDSATVSGFVKGVVTSAANAPLNGIIVQGGGASKTTGSNGAYFMPVSSGTVTVIANPNNANPSYIQNIQGAVIAEGAVTTQDFTLLLGGRLTGYVTTGTTPLPNQAITATNGTGSEAGATTTDASGVFTMRNMSTGTYRVFPVLESGQDVSPNDITTTLTSTGSVFVGTFTVSGAFGNIAGTVSDASGLVTSGALLLASTSSIASSPSAIVGSSAPAQTPLYMVSSKADGTYLLPVRGSTYYLSVYVPVISAAGTVSVTTKTYSGIVVAPGATTSRNVTIP